MSRAVSFLSLILLLAVVAVLLWFARDEAPMPVQNNAQVASPVAPVQAAALPEDTAALHGLVVDATGHLKMDADTRRAIGDLLGPSEKPPRASDVARAQATIRARLKEPAASEALKLLQDYLAYQEAARERAPEAVPAADNRLAAIVAVQNQATLRDKYLGAATNQALFEDEDALARYRLARQQVQQMTGLSPAQKEEQIGLLYQQLSPSAREVLKGASEAPAAVP